jgi:glycosyltransferase involved in cell wall biosynthesis
VPRISVLVPTYNHAPFVRETLDSILAQDHPDFRVVVADDASPDGTADIVEAHAGGDPRVRLLRAERNLGLAGNFNRLLGAIEGEYFAWLGGDDVMLPGKLSRQVAALEARPDAAGCVHDADVFVTESGQSLGRFSEVYNGRRGVPDRTVADWFRPFDFVLPSTMMVRTAARPEADYDERLRYANETVFDIETFRNGPCIGLDEVLVRYRRHEGNITRNPAMRAGVLEELLMAMAIVQARHPELTRLARRRRTSLLMAAGLDRAVSRDARGAARYLWAALLDGGAVRMASAAVAYARLQARRRRAGVRVPA